MQQLILNRIIEIIVALDSQIQKIQNSMMILNAEDIKSIDSRLVVLETKYGLVEQKQEKAIEGEVIKMPYKTPSTKEVFSPQEVINA